MSAEWRKLPNIKGKMLKQFLELSLYEAKRLNPNADIEKHPDRNEYRILINGAEK